MSAARPVVNSWDVFDTLLTRFVPEPSYVFEAMDRRHEGFRQARLGAQAALDKIGKPYVIFDIYGQMVAAGMDKEAARTLLAEELATERALMFPIRKAVAQVAPTDLIISDMYLSGEHITSLLADVCGLHTQPPIIRGNWGKHTGTIWPKILQNYVIRTHYGDNPAADSAVPQKYGISTVLLRDFELTSWEAMLAKAGLTQLARILREVRLRSLLAESGVFEALAAGPYLALLLAYACYLPMQFGGDAVFGFLSRDCDDLARVFRAVNPAAKCFNVDLSRRLARDSALEGVFRDLLPEPCVLVDGVSTGRSARGLLERIGQGGRAFTTLLWLDNLMRPEDAAFTGSFVHKASEFSGWHYALEFLLQSPYPPVTTLAHDAASGGIIRGFGAPELTPAEARLIGAKAEIVTRFLRAIRARGLPALTQPQCTALIKASIETIINTQMPATLFPSFMAREKFAPF